MTSRLNPYLSFNDNAREAMEFYESVFGGTLVLNTFGDIGGMEGEGAERIMHGMLETASGFTLMGADSAPNERITAGDNMAVSLSGDDGDELRGYWAALAEGGTVTVPLEKQMWGDEFGMCEDRFGTRWLVNITAPA